MQGGMQGGIRVLRVEKSMHARLGSTANRAGCTGMPLVAAAELFNVLGAYICCC